MKKTLRTESVEKLIQLAEENNIYYHFYDKNTFYSRKLDEKITKHHESYRDNLKKTANKFKIIGRSFKNSKRRKT